MARHEWVLLTLPLLLTGVVVAIARGVAER
jgi:hypothetical protein